MGHQANGIYIPPGSQREKPRVLPLYHGHAVAQKSPCERNRVILTVSLDVISLVVSSGGYYPFYVAAIVKPFGALFSFLVSPAALLVGVVKLSV